MKKVTVVKNTEVTIEKFNLDDFIENKESHATIKNITKKELRKIADSLGLDYKEQDIAFCKKILHAYLLKR